MRWDNYFDIECEYVRDGDYGSGYKYKLIVRSTKQLVGTYNDERYAKKQARRKFKKIADRVEKILLG